MTEPSGQGSPSTTQAESKHAGEEVRERWRSEELLGDKTEVLILHGTQVYRLRRTRQDKLILYK